MSLLPPTKTIFYSIESAIKAYRRFSQKNISKAIDDISIDQSMVLLFIDTYPELTQKEIV